MTNPETQDRGGWDFGAKFPRASPISKEFLFPILTLTKKQCLLGMVGALVLSPVLFLPCYTVSSHTVAGQAKM